MDRLLEHTQPAFVFVTRDGRVMTRLPDGQVVDVKSPCAKLPKTAQAPCLERAHNVVELSLAA